MCRLRAIRCLLPQMLIRKRAIGTLTPKYRGPAQDKYTTPGTHDHFRQKGHVAKPLRLPSAQRRPGQAPRQPEELIVPDANRDVRSTKTGAPAPASPSTGRTGSLGMCTLNEDRGKSPGNLLRDHSAALRRDVRSTKTGARAPAIWSR